jgi:hypothetical protein
VVGHPGYAPGVSPSQAARIGYLPRARGKGLKLAMAVPTRLALVNDTVDNRAPRRLRLRNLGFDKLVGVGGNAPLVHFRHVL